MIDYAFTVNGHDLRAMVYGGGYATNLVPVFSRTLTTIDGVDTKRLLRYRGLLTVSFNPMTDADAATVCAALLAAMPATVRYHCKQRCRDVTARMTVPGVPLQEILYKYRGLHWNEALSLTFTEL